MRLIDADKLINDGWVLERHGVSNKLLSSMSIADVPTAECEPIRHGHWIEKEEFLPWCDDDVDVIYECSCCKTESGGISPYCPKCGAKMDLKG